MTLAKLIAQLRADIATKLEQRNTHAVELEKLRGADTVDEAKVSEIRAAKAALDTEIDQIQARVGEYEAELARDEAADRLAREVHPGAPVVRTPDQRVRVGQEKRQYNPDSDRTGAQFVRDVGAAFLGDYAARDRLARHMDEERVERGESLERAVGVGAFAGLVVPQYLTDLVAPVTKAMRPLADAMNKHPLPPKGMTVNISRITTASSVALQTENNPASETNMDDTLLTIPVLTAAGQQTVSRQAIERGEGVEEIVLQDLFRAYATALDSTLINQAATGLSAVATAVAYTDATPTAAELYPKVLQATAASEAALLGQAAPDLAVMHSRRWYWQQSQVGTSWPFLSQAGIPPQSGGLVDPKSAYGSGFRGVLPSGLNVIVDNNTPVNLGAGVNEDELYIVPSAEAHLWEDPSAPVFIRAEQAAAASLGVLLVVYGYFAYTFGRYPLGFQKVGGTGLVTPVF